MAEPKSKSCSRCQQEKLANEFRPKRCICRPCERNDHKHRRDANPEKCREQCRQWRAAHPDRQHRAYNNWRKANSAYHAERNKKWYHANKVVVSARMKLYRERNPEKVAARKREYHKANAEHVRAKARAWAKANPERRWAQEQNRRARKLSLPNDWTGDDAAFALKHWKSRCAACRKKFKCWDHWIPLVNVACPGTVLWNMIPLCRFCNSTKQDRAAEKWLHERFPKQADQIARRVAVYFESVRLHKESMVQDAHRV